MTWWIRNIEWFFSFIFLTVLLETQIGKCHIKECSTDSTQNMKCYIYPKMIKTAQGAIDECNKLDGNLPTNLELNFLKKTFENETNLDPQWTIYSLLGDKAISKINLNNKYSSDKSCVVAKKEKQILLFVFASCLDRNFFVCIYNKNNRKNSPIKNFPTKDDSNRKQIIFPHTSILHLNQQSYEIWMSNCTNMRIRVGNIEMRTSNNFNFNISETFEWSMIKEMGLEVTCIDSAKTFIIKPVHLFEFMCETTLGHGNASQSSQETFMREFSNKIQLGEEVNFRVLDENIQFCKIEINSINKNALVMNVRKIINLKKFIPLFCVEEMLNYGNNNSIAWNFTKGNENQMSFPNICWIGINKIKKRKCILSESKIYPKYEWSPFKIEDCSYIGKCPPGYETVENRFCLKFTHVNDFEHHFNSLTGLEENVLDIAKRNNSQTILNYIQSKGYNQVLIPAKRINEFDRIIYISRFNNGGNYIANDPKKFKFQNSNDRYISFNIQTNSTKSFSKLEKNIPYVSLIDVEDLLQVYKISPGFSEMKPSFRIMDVCPDNTWYFSYYDGRCLKFFYSETLLSWEDAYKYCKNILYSLPAPENEFIDLIFREALVNEGVSSVWIGGTVAGTNNSYLNNFNKEPNVLTTSGRYSLKEGPLINVVLCETKNNITVLTSNVKLYLTERETNENKILCLNFNVKKLLFLKNFPTCYCYPDWRKPMMTRMGTHGCDYEMETTYSTICQCTAVILHFNSASVIHSNKIKVFDKFHNHFVLYIETFQDFILKDSNDNIQNILNKNVHRWISGINHDDRPCSYSNLHINYQKMHVNSSKSYTLHIGCSKAVFYAQLKFKEIEKLLNKNLKIKVTGRPTTGCHQDVAKEGSKILTWKRTNGAGYYQPYELCLTQQGNPTFRECEGNHFIGFRWKDFQMKCKTDVNIIDKNIHLLLASNTTNKINKLQNIIFENKSKISGYIVNAAADILADEKQAINYSVNDVISIVESITEYSVKNISNINRVFNTSNKILASFDELLIKRILFANSSQQKAKKYKNLLIHEGKIPSKNDQEIIAIGVDDKGKKFSLLGNLSRNNKFDVIFSIPKCVLSNHKEIGYLYKEWKNSLFFEDLSLSRNNQKLLRNIIDINFVDLKTKQTAKKLNGSIIIKFKQKENNIKTNNNFSCVSWNLRKSKWTTFGWINRNSRINDNYITCIYNHLTHYAILFNGDIPDEDKIGLNIIVYIGASLSILVLVVVISSSILLKNWPKTEDVEAKGLVNLCIAILGATLAMLVGFEQSVNKVLCKIFAATLHYFLLSSFCWMFFEAIFKYLNYVKGYRNLENKLYKISFCVSWGLPLFISAILWTIRFTLKYKTLLQNNCWLTKYEIYFGFILPLGIFMSLNICIYSSIIFSLWKIMRASAGLRHSESPEKRIKRVIIEVISLGLLFGLTWLFGLLIMTGNMNLTKIFSYIFSALHSLQGFFIFIRIYNNKFFKKEWKHYINELRGFNSRSRDTITAFKKSNIIETKSI